MENTQFTFNDLHAHVGHKIEIHQFGKTCELQCTTCRTTLAEASTDNLQKDAQLALFESAPACNMDEGCEACGS